MMSIEQLKATIGEEFTFFFQIIQAQLQRLNLEKNARILDVGTGMGRVAVTLALSGYRVLTGEPEDDNSEYAKQAWRKEAQKADVTDLITFKPFDSEKMPFSDKEFDAVFMMGALHHINSPAAAISECIRVMAPNGVFCIMEPSAKLVELARKKHPSHPASTDPRPFLEGMALQTFHEEMFDVFTIHHGS